MASDSARHFAVAPEYPSSFPFDGCSARLMFPQGEGGAAGGRGGSGGGRGLGGGAGEAGAGRQHGAPHASPQSDSIASQNTLPKSYMAPQVTGPHFWPHHGVVPSPGSSVEQASGRTGSAESPLCFPPLAASSSSSASGGGKAGGAGGGAAGGIGGGCGGADGEPDDGSLGGGAGEAGGALQHGAPHAPLQSDSIASHALSYMAPHVNVTAPRWHFCPHHGLPSPGSSAGQASGRSAPSARWHAAASSTSRVATAWRVAMDGAASFRCHVQGEAMQRTPATG